MDIYPTSAGVVITLEEPEQFRFTPPDDVTPDVSWYATRAQTVTVFAPTPGESGYFTVAGEQIHAPQGVVGEDRFWELPMQFTDSGPLPPHVRSQVEGLVPVVDRRVSAGREQVTAERRAQFEALPPDAQDVVVEQVQLDELLADNRTHRAGEGAGGAVGRPELPLGAVGSEKSWSERLADRGKRLASYSTESHTPARGDVVRQDRRILPGDLGRQPESGAWRRLDLPVNERGGKVLHQTPVVDPVLPPSAFLNTSQVRDRGGR